MAYTIRFSRCFYFLIHPGLRIISHSLSTCSICVWWYKLWCVSEDGNILELVPRDYTIFCTPDTANDNDEIKFTIFSKRIRKLQGSIYSIARHRSVSIENYLANIRWMATRCINEIQLNYLYNLLININYLNISVVL